MVGRTVQVITTIPENGTGEIAVEAKGSRINGPARSVDGRAISAQCRGDHCQGGRKPLLRSEKSVRQRRESAGSEELASPGRRSRRPGGVQTDLEGSMAETNLAFVIVGLALAFILAIYAVARRYKKVGPNQVMVISGRKYKIKTRGRPCRRSRIPHPPRRRRLHHAADREGRPPEPRDHDARTSRPPRSTPSPACRSSSTAWPR